MNVETKVSLLSIKEGDSILVEVTQILTPKQTNAIQRAVEKWSGNKYPVLVVCLPLIRLRVVSGS